MKSIYEPLFKGKYCNCKKPKVFAQWAWLDGEDVYITVCLKCEGHIKIETQTDIDNESDDKEVQLSDD